MKKLIIYISLILGGGSCAVGPNFKSPQVALPESYLNDTTAIGLTNNSFDKSWWENFGDPTLDSLIEQAIENNKDLQSAYNNIIQAELVAKNAGKALLPELGIAASGGGSYNNTDKTTQSYTVTPTINWEIDVFGGLRRSREAARAEALSTRWGYRSLMLTLVCNVADNYFSLLENKELLNISQQTYALRAERLNLMDSIYHYGAISLLDYNSAKTLLLNAGIAVETYKNNVNQYERALNILLGENPKPIATSAKGLYGIKIPKTLPDRMPAWVMENRPDILQAYYQLMKSNAEIGVAVAKRYPSLSINASGGILYNIAASGAATTMPFVWNGAFQILESLFNWGVNKRNVEIAKLSNKSDLLSFEQTVLKSFNEIEVSLGAINALQKQCDELNKLVTTTSQTNDMTLSLYNAGLVNYLNVLDSQRELFNSQLSWVSTTKGLLSGYLSLYKAVGGGW